MTTKVTTAPVEDTVTYEDVATAAFRIQDGIAHTYARYSAAFSEETGCKVHLKMDHKQFTGSFKERGALNALMLLPQEVHRCGVICASAGNHALAVTYHAKRLGIPVSVVMPTTAPLAKVGRCRKLGADVHLHGQTIADAKVYAEQLLQKTGQVYINGYNDLAIIAGAGTLGMEMVHDVKDVDAVIVPIGGGGLIAGIAVAIKKLRPEVLVIGAEPVACPSFTRALEAGKPVTVQAKPTLADGLAVPTVGDRAFRVARNLVDKVVLVQERHIALAVLRMLEHEKAIVEGAGAIGLAALLDPTLLPELKGKTVVLPTCGGNIDVNVLHRVIDRGLAADGRLIKVVCTISDRPGGLAAFCRVIADTGASIRDINHDRAFTDRDVSTAVAHCVLETTGPEHSALVRRKLEEAGHLPPSFAGGAASKL